MSDWYRYPNRLLCSVLEEMREGLEVLGVWNIVRYKPHMKLLIEEAQTLANRMEAGLQDQADLREFHKDMKKIKGELRSLEKEKKDLELTINNLKQMKETLDLFMDTRSEDLGEDL